jgi:DNA adenine methylase
MKPVFSWPGGKSWASKHVLPLIPQHACYVEPFAGGLAILLAKEPSALEVVNDINSDLINFFRCVKFHRDELIKELQWVLNSREEFTSFKQQPGLTDIQRAARWFCRQTLSFGGDGDSFAVTRKPGGGANKSRHSLLEKLGALNDRLDKVVTEHLDWHHCLELYDSSETFFFVDPPYLGGKIKNYKAWGEADLKSLRDCLVERKGKWILTINDCEAARSLFQKQKKTTLTRQRGIANRTEKDRQEYKELLIRSF